MARPRNADGQRTRQAILDAGLALFAEKGYFGTSLRDVARAVGVTESALYNYFDGKDALFDALLRDHHDAKSERMAALAAVPITDGYALLEQIAVETLERFATERERQFFSIVMSDGLRLARLGRINLAERMASGRERLHELLRRLVDEGWLRPADINVLGLAFLSPLVLWRQLHAVDADLPMIRQPRVFARQHVEQFLLGAAGPAVRAPRPSRSSPSPARRAVPRRRAAT